MKSVCTATTFGPIATAGKTASGGGVLAACLITKTNTKPFFVKTRESSTAKAEALGTSLNASAGKINEEHETQVTAKDLCFSNGVKISC